MIFRVYRLEEFRYLSFNIADLIDIFFVVLLFEK